MIVVSMEASPASLFFSLSFTGNACDFGFSRSCKVCVPCANAENFVFSLM